MRTKVLTTAFGWSLIIHPSIDNIGWYVVAADKNGNWRGMNKCKTKEEARKLRTQLFADHRRLKKLEKHNV